MKSISNAIRKIYITIVVAFALVILTLLCAYNASSTTFLINWEHTVYVNDSVFFHVALVVVTLFILVKCSRSASYKKFEKWIEEYEHFQKLKFILLCCIFGIGTIWALSTQFIPGVDEYDVQNIVAQALKGDFSGFSEHAYMDQHPNQWGLFVVSYLLALFFGARNYLMLEILIAFSISMVFKELSEIAELFGIRRAGQLAVIAVGALYIPFSLYSVMVYGNMVGIAFALAAIKYELLYFKSGRVEDVIKCGAYIGFAVMVKSNMQIYFLAIVFTAMINLFKDIPRALKLIFVVLTGYFLQSAGTEFFVRHLTQCTLDAPITSLAFVAMGLQETDQAPGWWNSYTVNSYFACSGDVVQHSIMVKADIMEALKGFLHNPRYAVEFFTQKVLSTWANPTFQCFSTVRNGTYIETPHWVNWLLSYHTQYIVATSLNFICFMIYFGALLNLLLDKFDDENNLVLIMTFIGGFVFYLFWETKARYALMFFVVLIPCAIKGFSLASAEIQEVLQKHIKPIRKIRLVIVLVIVIVFFCLYFGKFNYLLNQDTETYKSYISNLTFGDYAPYVGK